MTKSHENIKQSNELEKTRGYLPGMIEHLMQPKGGRDLSTYEKHLLFDRKELQGKTILDLGTGPEAKFAKQLKEAGIKAEVVSLSPDFEEKKYRQGVKKSFPEGQFISAVGQALPFKNESFDRIFAFHVLEHLSSKERLLGLISEIARVLKKGGKATLGTVTEVEDFYTSILVRDTRIVKQLKNYGVEIVREDIPADTILIESMKDYRDNPKGERVYNVTCHNIVLIKSE